MNERFQLQSEIVKLDETHGVVLGWALISKIDGAEYVDLQGDHVTEKAAFAAAVDFAENSGELRVMHGKEAIGKVLFVWPATTDVLKAFGFQSRMSGLLVGVKPSSAVLARYRSGELKGFSIGGRVLESTSEAT